MNVTFTSTPNKMAQNGLRSLLIFKQIFNKGFVFYTDKDDSTNIHKTNWQATNFVT